MDNNDETTLAMEIAEQLNDHASLAQFTKYTKLYSSSFLREMLRKTLAMPQEKITSSRAALFTFLVKTYGKSNFPRHNNRY